MGKLIVAIAIVAAIAYVFHQGWIGQWIGKAADSGIESVKRTQDNATKQRAADPGAPEAEKK
jgi:hypothetical protein